MRFPALAVCIVAVAALVSGCTGPAQTVVYEPEPDPVIPPEVAEPFDIGPYRDEPASISVPLIHDVPDDLMENKADAGVLQTINGFRVQVYSTMDPEDAARAEERAQQAWGYVSDRLEELELHAAPSVYRFFRQPYYRIRVGDFADRNVAEAYAAAYAGVFSGAFVVPDRVTVRR